MKRGEWIREEEATSSEKRLLTIAMTADAIRLPEGLRSKLWKEWIAVPGPLEESLDPPRELLWRRRWFTTRTMCLIIRAKEPTSQTIVLVSIMEAELLL